MSTELLTVAIILAYGPFAVMVALYICGLGLRLAGRPGFLRDLIERTEIRQPVARDEGDGAG